MVESTLNNSIQTINLNLGNGWLGKVTTGINCCFTPGDWKKLLAEPHTLFQTVDKVIKTEQQNCVAVKSLQAGSKKLTVVIKRHCPQNTFRDFFRSFRPGKALRNFNTSIKLINCGIPTAMPLAALQQKKLLSTTQSIFITQYLENALSLYNFIAANMPKNIFEQFKLKKQLCSIIAQAFALMDKNNFWHKDSKANNFVVSFDPHGQLQLTFIDMDGIKPNCPFFGRNRRCRRSLWQLAASLIPLAVISRTDYLRTFTYCCDLAGINKSDRGQIYKKLVYSAQKKYLSSMLKKFQA